MSILGSLLFCRFFRSVVFLFISLFFLSSNTLAIDTKSADSLVNQWLNIERQTTSLEIDWANQKPLLEQRIALLQAEKAQQEKILETSDESQGDVETKRAELLAEQNTVESRQLEIEGAVQQLIARLGEIGGWIPPVLNTSWAEEKNELGVDPTVSNKLQTALAQLSLLDGFNQRVSLYEVPMSLPVSMPSSGFSSDFNSGASTEGNTMTLVKQLYLGLGSAWLVTPDQTHVAIGKATPEGWQWQFDTDLDRKEVTAAISMFEKTQEADFVSLPVRADLFNESRANGLGLNSITPTKEREE